MLFAPQSSLDNPCGKDWDQNSGLVSPFILKIDLPPSSLLTPLPGIMGSRIPQKPPFGFKMTQLPSFPKMEFVLV